MNLRRYSTLLSILFISFLFTVALSAQDMATVKAEEVGLSSTRLQVLTHTLQQYVDEGKLAGGVALVARRGKIAYLHAFDLSGLS